MTVHNHGIDPSCREVKVGECLRKPGTVVLDLWTAPEFTKEGQSTGYPSHAQCLVSLLRGCGTQTADWVADQIEAQTKPARIPEPGWGQKVVASTAGYRSRRSFLNTGRGWVERDHDELASLWRWDDLLDPERI